MIRTCPSCMTQDYYLVEVKNIETTYDISKEEGNLLVVELDTTKSKCRQISTIREFFECKICKKRWPLLYGIKVKKEEPNIEEAFQSFEEENKDGYK